MWSLGFDARFLAFSVSHDVQVQNARGISITSSGNITLAQCLARWCRCLLGGRNGLYRIQ